MKTGIEISDILLPKTDDYSAFAVVACDQFTSDGEYWETLKKLTAGKLTMLDMMLPEYYLNGNDTDERIKTINANIDKYSKNTIVVKEGMILSVRGITGNRQRIGLITVVDLEEYDYKKGSKSLIRATEATIADRIPPRLKIRKDAPMEFPHVLVFIDDEKREIIEPLYQNKEGFDKLYDFELNMNGGHIVGYKVPNPSAVKEKFTALINKDRLIQKYGEDYPFAMAVGDGNHSLATAKAHWENIKKNLPDSELINHPARFALVEIINIYDDGVVFEPIHRIVKGVNKEKFALGFEKIIHGKETLFMGDNSYAYNGELSVPESIIKVDEYVKAYIEKFGGEVDYVHGDLETKEKVTSSNDAVAILFNPIDKSTLFPYVVKGGCLPKKTFSIGEGRDKRYYLEGRKITK
ncbi:MAG: DUF1015 domain-containing protein [Clostridia bacterium]|nr:DUF1015 domain-containing protein [Clostridia bacterium]